MRGAVHILTVAIDAPYQESGNRFNHAIGMA